MRAHLSSSSVYTRDATPLSLAGSRSSVTKLASSVGKVGTTFDHRGELGLRGRDLAHVELAHDGNLHLIAATDGKRRVHHAAVHPHLLVLVEEEVHGVADARVHGVRDDAVADL